MSAAMHIAVQTAARPVRHLPRLSAAGRPRSAARLAGNSVCRAARTSSGCSGSEPAELAAQEAAIWPGCTALAGQFGRPVWCAVASLAALLAVWQLASFFRTAVDHTFVVQSHLLLQTEPADFLGEQDRLYREGMLDCIQLVIVMSGVLFVSAAVRFAAGLLTGSGIDMPALGQVLEVAILSSQFIAAVFFYRVFSEHAIEVWRAGGVMRAAGGRPPSITEILFADVAGTTGHRRATVNM